MPNHRMLALAFVVALAPFSGSEAQPRGSERANLQMSCTGDYLRFCAGTEPGGPEVEACFKRNMRNLSPGCRGAISGYLKRNPGGGHPDD